MTIELSRRKIDGEARGRAAEIRTWWLARYSSSRVSRTSLIGAEPGDEREVKGDASPRNTPPPSRSATAVSNVTGQGSRRNRRTRDHDELAKTLASSSADKLREIVRGKTEPVRRSHAPEGQAPACSTRSTRPTIRGVVDARS